MRSVSTIITFCGGIACALAFGGVSGLNSGLAQPGQKAEPAPPALRPTAVPLVTAAQLPASGLPPPPTLVEHAVNAGLGQCSSVLEKMSREIIRGPYNVQSGWNLREPAGHVFQSVAGLRNPGNRPENALAAFIAAPLGGDCDGVAVQVYPLPLPCGAVQDVAQQGGQQIANLEGVRVVLDAKKARLFLLPGGGANCIAVSVKSYFGGS
jgi:hypothetical protein